MECHATGTAVGDVIELQAIGDVFGDAHDLETNPLRIASVKSNIGHAEVAAGIFSVIKIVQMLKYRFFLPTAGVTTPRLDFNWEKHNMKVQQELEPFPDDELVVVGVNSFGIGGAYGHVVMQEYRPPRPTSTGFDEVDEDNGTGYLMPLSAVSLPHLQIFAENLAKYLEANKDKVKLRDFCGTMAVNRSRFQYRKTFTANTTAEMADKLAAFAKNCNVQPSGEGRKMQVAFVFTGQGSQWPGVGKSLMAFPVYRKAVKAVDKLFKSKTGWSILEKINTLTQDEMVDTIYAQPVTFLVQVGLFELLKTFRIFPDVVVGHSAGEVPAAYASGLLTLEEAVEVVFHRSAEQQRMAGCGRMLAVGLSEDDVKEYIKDFADVEIACINSGQSTVLASSEERLKEVVAKLPEGTFKAFVPGNIAFHSSRVEPILDSMRQRLAFLNKRPKVWGLPYVSTVSGKVETSVDADYWARNVRCAVNFKKAIETIFSQDVHPDVVVEIGPHKTLVSPIMQIIGDMSKSAMVIPTLKKNGVCTTEFLETVGALFEKGLTVDLKPWYTELRYRFLERLPPHPYIKKRMHEQHPVLKNDMRNGCYLNGPVAGFQKFFDGAFVSEVSDKTYKKMCDHKMGGQAILPGMFFVEMALEAAGGFPCTLTNVEFKSMLKIPMASQGDTGALLGLNFKEEQDGVKSFMVRSVPVREKFDEEPVFVEHCAGKVVPSELVDADGKIKTGFKPEAFGLMGGLELKDIGEDGLKNLIARHTQQEHGSKENFYGTHCVEGVMEYMESFQLVDTVHVDPKTMSILGKITYDNEVWQKQGGVIGVQLLDALLHQTLILATHSAIYYAGGFDAAHFLRLPKGKDLWVYFTLDKYRLQIGRKKKVGDFAVYDSEGKLIMYIQGFFTVFGSFTDNYKLCDLLWQPFEGSQAKDQNLLKNLALPASEWTADDNDNLSAAVVQKLKASSALEDALKAEEGKKKGKGAGSSLAEQITDAIKETSSAVKQPLKLPTVAKLNENFDAVLKVLEGKIKKAELTEEQQNLLSGDDVKALASAATFTATETTAIAQALLAQADANQKALGTNYVFRVLEVAEEATDTVVEALSRLDIPSTIIIEYFVGSHNAGLLKSLATKVNRRTTNIRLRKLFINDTVYFELKDMTFEALVFAKWARSGTSGWESKEATAASQALTQLRTFLVPGANVFTYGLYDLPLWVRLLSQASSAAVPLLNAVKGDAAAQEFLEAFNAVGQSKAVALGGSKILSGRYSGYVKAEAARYVLVAADSLQADQIKKALLERNSQATIETVLIAKGGQLTDASTTDDFVPVLEKAMGVKPEPVEGEETKETEPSEPFKGIIFAGALNDDSVIGDKAFSRVLKLAQALLKLSDKVKGLRANEVAEPASLWVLTRGAYVGEIKPSQGTMQGMSTVLCSECPDFITKHVDLSTLGDIPQVADLVLSDAREKSFAIVSGAIKVARFNAIDRKEARSMRVLATDKTSYFANITNGVSVPGEFSVAYHTKEVGEPGDDEVQIDIYAAALNFRDVMIALSLLPEKSYERSYYGRNLGLEAAGVIAKVGKNVKGLKVGDRVMTGEPCCFANRLNAPADRVVWLPETTAFEDAASLQSVYNTSHHALVNLARVRPGEKVLIHSAAGGIGHAAISICKHLGAVIYATAGSEDKRQLVREMGVDKVYDSRSISWFDDLMKDTEGQGVDVILNSLAGKHQRLGVQALRSSGRFLEIGKMDIFDNNGLGLLAFRKNISFFAIDMDRLALDDRKMTEEIGKTVGYHFKEGHYHKLPVHTFPMDQIKDALEFMKTGKHIGKVVLTNYEKKGDKFVPLAVTVEKPQTMFHANGTYLITGGAGGFGSKLLRFAYFNGARHFLITTRSADTEKTKAAFRDIVDQPGVTLEVLTIDTGKEEDVTKLVNHAKAMKPPLCSIFHVAGVSIDIVLPEMKPEDFYDVANCKAAGAWWLHEKTLGLPLENFACVSSIASLIGGLGMASYSSSNAFLDALMRYRRSLGLPGSTFNMSSLSDVGILANNLNARKFQLKMGVEYITSFRALQELELGLVSNMNPIITMFFKEKTRTMFPFQAPWSHHLQETITLGAVASKGDFMTAKEIAAFLSEEIKDITGASEVLVTAQLVTLGLDSFGFVELGGRIKKHFGIEVNSVKMSPDNTLEDVSKIIYKLQSRGSGGKATEAAEGEQESEIMVLHNKAEMNNMISTRFESGPPLVRTASSLTRGLRSLSGATLLFGATGLTGAHVLRYLIKSGASKVYCVVRSATAEGARARIEKAMRNLRIWKDSFSSSIVALAGEMGTANFGLKPDVYAQLVSEVDTVVHAAGSRNWHMDQESITCNISGLMNIVTMARKNHASVHYVSSGWLDAEEAASEEDRETLQAMPYVQIKRRAEDILNYAARHYKLACFAYRLPLISVNTKGGFTGDFVVFQVMQTMGESGMLPDEFAAASSYPIMPADFAAKYVVRQMQRVPRSTKGKALIMSASSFAEIVTVDVLSQWTEEMKHSKLNRKATMNELQEHFAKRLAPEVRELQSKFIDFLFALGRSSEQLRIKIRKDASFRTVLDKTLYYSPKVTASSVLKSYIAAHPTTLDMKSSMFDESYDEDADAADADEAEPEAAQVSS